jgi:hypothetical protein
MTDSSRRLVANWESRSRKHWLALWADSHGYSYESPGARGFLGALEGCDLLAIGEMERRLGLGLFQPDRNKTPLSRIR